MPNWCQNRVTIERPSPELLTYLALNGFSFERFCPVEPSGEPADDLEDLVRQTQLWGTKWDLDEGDQSRVAEELAGGGVSNFETAWSPPIPALEALSKLFPRDRITLDYCELGNMIAGSAVFRRGRCIECRAGDERSILKVAREIFGYEDDDG